MTHPLLNQLSELAARDLADAFSMPPAIYHDTDVEAQEYKHIWEKDWVCPGLAAEIPNTGDYLTYSIAGEAIYCIRDKAGAVKTYSNVCRHRMMQLVHGRGNKSRVVCPYHAWTYSLEGKLIGAGHMDRSNGFTKSDICLPEIRTEIWNGWIYVTLNADAPSVADSLSALDDVVGRYNMAGYIPVAQQDHVWNTNWKLLTENFMEGYHLPVAHKATVGAWFPVEETVFPEGVFDNFTYQTFQKGRDAKYGLAHPDNTVLEGEWRYTSILPTVFPAHMYVLAPDHLWYLSLRPREVGHVEVRFGVALAPELHASLDDPETWLMDLGSFFDMVNSEDRDVVEGIYLGSKSSLAAPGPLSWLEREIHDFERYLARRLCGGTT